VDTAAAAEHRLSMLSIRVVDEMAKVKAFAGMGCQTYPSFLFSPQCTFIPTHNLSDIDPLKHYASHNSKTGAFPAIK